jgi:hypothetical protein
MSNEEVETLRAEVRRLREMIVTTLDVQRSSNSRDYIKAVAALAAAYGPPTAKDHFARFEPLPFTARGVRLSLGEMGSTDHIDVYVREDFRGVSVRSGAGTLVVIPRASNVIEVRRVAHEEA